MKDFFSNNFFAIVVLAFLAYWFLIKSKDVKEANELKQQNIILQQNIDTLKVLILNRRLERDTLKIVHNYNTVKYINESKKVDSVYSPDSLIWIIKSQRDYLRPAKFK